MDWLSERFKHDYEGKRRISYKEYSQIYDKYTGVRVVRIKFSGIKSATWKK